MSPEERRAMAELNPDVFILGALKLTEDVRAITATQGFRETASEYIEPQYAMDSFVGDAVAQNLFAVANSVDARAVLPDRTVAILEVNANRGFPVGREDSAGCYGLPIDWLGHVVIDLDYDGADQIVGATDDRRIDYLGEPGSWTTFSDQALERNATRVRIRPAYPEHPKNTFHLSGGLGPQDIFKKRAGMATDEKGFIYPEYATLRGEYRICRAVALLHDLTDWETDEFVTALTIVEEEVRRDMGLLD